MTDLRNACSFEVEPLRGNQSCSERVGLDLWEILVSEQKITMAAMDKKSWPFILLVVGLLKTSRERRTSLGNLVNSWRQLSTRVQKNEKALGS